MRIAFLATLDNVHTRRWLEYMRKHDHEVAVFCDAPVKEPLSSTETIHPEMNLLTKVIAFKLFPRPYGNNYFKFLPYRRELKRWRPDVVHGFDVIGYGLATALSGCWGKILTPWGNDIFDHPRRSRLARWLVSFSLRHVDLVSTNMPNLADYLMAEFSIRPERIRPFSWGIDLNLFRRDYEREVQELRERLELPENARVVISNRQMGAYWGIEQIVRAIPEVVREFPDAHFVFLRGTGSKVFEQEMVNRARELGIYNHCRFVGELLTAKEMAVYLNLAEIFVSVPQTDLLSLSVLEGLACGAVAIVSELPAYKPRIEEGKTGFYVPLGDSQVLAEKLLYVLRYPQIRGRFYGQLRPLLEREDDWSRNAHKMEELYAQVAGRGARKGKGAGKEKTPEKIS